MKELAVDGYDISSRAVERAIVDEVIRKKAPNFAGYRRKNIKKFIPYWMSSHVDCSDDRELADFFRYCAKIWQVWANLIDAK